MPQADRLKRLLNDWDAQVAVGHTTIETEELVSALRGEVVRLKATLVDISNHSTVRADPQLLSRMARDALL